LAAARRNRGRAPPGSTRESGDEPIGVCADIGRGDRHAARRCRFDRAPDPEALRAWFEGRAAKCAVPDRVEIADAPPQGATGKILKTELRRISLA
jgi:acyl-CoA synthetase (AMP-forming)/AMP-acid ligase II